MRNFWQLSAKLLEKAANFSETQPTSSAEAHSFSVKSTLHSNTSSVSLHGCPQPLSPSTLSTGKRYKRKSYWGLWKRQGLGHLHPQLTTFSTEYLKNARLPLPRCCTSTTTAGPLVRFPNSGNKPSSDSIQRAQLKSAQMTCPNLD